MDLSPQDVLNALRTVNDPHLQKDIVSLGFVKDIEVGDGRVSVLMQTASPARNQVGEHKTRCERTGCARC